IPQPPQVSCAMRQRVAFAGPRPKLRLLVWRPSVPGHELATEPGGRTAKRLSNERAHDSHLLRENSSRAVAHRRGNPTGSLVIGIVSQIVPQRVSTLDKHNMNSVV